MSKDIGAAFRALHKPGDPFILANAWDAGSAKMLAELGAQAIGTTSAGHAFTLGLADGGTVTRDQALAHAEALVAATPLPVSGDFENGYGHAPDMVAETVRLAAEVGLAGCSIEDEVWPDAKAYDFDFAVERVRAGAAAARGLSRDFVFVARADGVMNGHYDTAEAIRRVQAFAAAGADCVYVPLPLDLAEIKQICASVTVPVNALATGRFANYSRQDFASAGVARISVGSALAKVAQRAAQNAARPMLAGDFSHLLK